MPIYTYESDGPYALPTGAGEAEREAARLIVEHLKRHREKPDGRLFAPATGLGVITVLHDAAIARTLSMDGAFQYNNRDYGPYEKLQKLLEEHDFYLEQQSWTRSVIYSTRKRELSKSITERQATYERLARQHKPEGDSLEDNPKRFLLVEGSLWSIRFSTHESVEAAAEYFDSNLSGDWEINSVYDLDNPQVLYEYQTKTTITAATPLVIGDPNWEARVQAYEDQGMTRSDAQGAVDAEDRQKGTK